MAYEEIDEDEEGEHPDDNTRATRDKVVAYIVRTYSVTPEVAGKAVTENKEILDSGILHGSFTYYVGDRIYEKYVQTP